MPGFGIPTEPNAESELRYSAPAVAGKLTVSPSSASLAAGANVTVTVTLTSLVALDGQLTVNPGGQTVTVVLSIGL